MTVLVSSSAGCLNNDCGLHGLPSVTDNNNETYLATAATTAATEVGCECGGARLRASGYCLLRST